MQPWPKLPARDLDSRSIVGQLEYVFSLAWISIPSVCLRFPAQQIASLAYRSRATPRPGGWGSRRKPRSRSSCGEIIMQAAWWMIYMLRQCLATVGANTSCYKRPCAAGMAWGHCCCSDFTYAWHAVCQQFQVLHIIITCNVLFLYK